MELPEDGELTRDIFIDCLLMSWMEDETLAGTIYDSLDHEQHLKVLEWSGDIMLNASDNDDVDPGPIPSFLNKLLPTGHFYRNWGVPADQRETP